MMWHKEAIDIRSNSYNNHEGKTNKHISLRKHDVHFMSFSATMNLKKKQKKTNKQKQN